jgi:hypothetical protein
MRPEVSYLVNKGPLPSSSASIQQIKEWQEALERITAPLSDDEAEALTALFPAKEDECYGLAWVLVHLVETAPHWPLEHCLKDRDNPWIVRFRRAARLD